jgi:hypothetical protein
MIQKCFDAETRGQKSKQFWLTPPELYEALDKEFHFDFDPCPFPRDGFDGLTSDWGLSSYVNAPYSSVDGKGGFTQWEYKAIEEWKKGKTVVLLKPCNTSEHALYQCKPEIRCLGRIPWVATDGSQDRKAMRNYLAIILRASQNAIKEDKT